MVEAEGNGFRQDWLIAIVADSTHAVEVSRPIGRADPANGVPQSLPRAIRNPLGYPQSSPT
jgi:hypothetical protein